MMLCGCIPRLLAPSTKERIHVGHHVLLPEHLETDCLHMPQVDDGMIELEKAYELHPKLRVSWLIDAEELVPALDRNKIQYLIGETYALKHHGQWVHNGYIMAIM